MRKPVIIIFALLLVIYSASVLALYVVSNNRAPEFTSAHTPVDKNCERTVGDGEVGRGRAAAQTCDGFGDYRLRKSFGAVAASLQVEADDDHFVLPLAKAGECLPAFGDKIEWRLADRKPFAVIVKVSCYRTEPPADGYSYYADENRTGEFLIVRGLKGHERISYELDARSAANPEEEARQLADRNYDGKNARD